MEKIGHAKKTCHNKKKEEHVKLVVPIKIVEPIAKVIAQPIKPFRIPLKYPSIICSNFEYRAPNCFRKMEVQKMFQTKP